MDGGRETVVSVVTNLDGFFLGLELLDSNDGAEDLLLNDLHVLGDIDKGGRLDVVALVAVALTADENLGTSLLALINVAHDTVELELGHLGTLEGVLVERVADLVGGCALLEALDELVVDALLDEEAGTGTAALAVVEEDTEVGPRNGVINIGVVEDDVGRLASQLQSDLLQVTLSCGLEDGTANGGRTSEGDLVDAHMGRDGRTRNATKARDDVNNTRRESSLLDELGSVESG